MKRILLLNFLLLFTLAVAAATTIQTMNNFDSSKYLGKWYEIARLPNVFEKNCVAPVTANYSVNLNNPQQLVVINSCNSKKDEINQVVGSAFFTESPTISKLKVNFLPKLLKWIPFSSGDYWVMYTDYNDVAVVGSPDHKYLWILGRTSTLKADILDNAIAIAKSQGFDTSKLIFN
jgi:apolipoprotein D and lipocalin family protein